MKETVTFVRDISGSEWDIDGRIYYLIGGRVYVRDNHCYRLLLEAGEDQILDMITSNKLRRAQSKVRKAQRTKRVKRIKRVKASEIVTDNIQGW